MQDPPHFSTHAPESADAILGIDVSKDSLDGVLLLTGQPPLTSRRYPHHKVANDPNGFQDLLTWAQGRTPCATARLRVTLEATSVYHLPAANFFHDAGCQIVVTSSHRSREFGHGIGRLTKTDKVDALILAIYGEHANTRLWHPPPHDIDELRALLWRLHLFTVETAREQRRLELEQVFRRAKPVLISFARVRTFHTNERARLLAAIERYFRNNPTRNHERQLLLTIPGVGLLTASYLLCHIRSKPFNNGRQVAALTGLVPIHRISADTPHCRPRISREGNPRLRGALYMPAVVAIKRNPALSAIYKQLRANGKPAKLALTAVMRRLVHIAFGVLKHGCPFDPQWEQTRRTTSTVNAARTE